MAHYDIIPDLSTVSIVGRSTLHPIHAAASGLTGWVIADVDQGRFTGDAVTGYVEIPVALLQSGNRLVDAETRRRIDAARFPLISGTITSTIETRDATATVRGVIAFRGEEVEVEGTLIAAGSAETLTLIGESVFDVRWWGLEPPKLLAVKVYPEIRVEVHVELRPR